MKRFITTLILALIVSVGLAQEIQIISRSASKIVLENGQWSTSKPAEFLTYIRLTPRTITIKDSKGEVILSLKIKPVKQEEFETHTTYVFESEGGDVIQLALFKQGYGSTYGKIWVSQGNTGVIMEVDEGRFVDGTTTEASSLVHSI